jgi:regulator of RNase E activity RraA
MSTAARAKGILGVVVDGGIRDIKEHRDMEFPVCTRSFCRAHFRSTLGITRH